MVFLIFDIFHNIPNFAVENAAEHFDRVRADAFVALEARDLRGTDAVLFDEGVLRDALFLHDLPQIVI